MGRGSDDEEEEELAAIRAARQAKLGLASTISLSALRDQKRRAEDDASKAALYLASSRQQGSGTKVVVAVEDAAAAVGPTAPPHPAAATPAAAPAAAVADSDSGSDEEAAASPDDGAPAEEDDGMLMHEGMRQYFPLSFGQQEQKVDRPDAIHAQHRRQVEAAGQLGPKSDTAGAGGFGPPRPPVKIKQIGQGDVPGTVQQQLALAGAGSMDMNMRLYDFNGMKRDMKAFRELEAQEGHPVLALSWSPTGELLLAVTGSAKAKIFDRDGHTKGEFVRGVMYIRDPRNTKGHVSALTCGQWHPQDRYTAARVGPAVLMRLCCGPGAGLDLCQQERAGGARGASGRHR
ncbi:WD_REPEATS_REGION domain-containing protein, partial [Haematococcus lacustris]